MTGDILTGDILTRDILTGTFCPGHFDRGHFDLVPLVVVNFVFKDLRRHSEKFVPRLKIWKLKDESSRAIFAGLVAARADEFTGAVGMNEMWKL